ncbi:hypothetical protein D3C75_942370 [compost metagenome]
MYGERPQRAVELYTSQLMCKYMIIMQADDGSILCKIGVVGKPDCRLDTQLFNFIDLFQMILRKHMQPVHDQHCSRLLPGGDLQHGIRRAEDQLTDKQLERFCDSCINRFKPLGDIHEL